MITTSIYHVETECGEFLTTDRDEARAYNRANPGSSMWYEPAE